MCTGGRWLGDEGTCGSLRVRYRIRVKGRGCGVWGPRVGGMGITDCARGKMGTGMIGLWCSRR